MKLPAEQEAIAREIRRLHGRREPLNISAVKRTHPKLLARVYAQEPFWGWKRALQAAGLSYSDIRTELADSVECMECGEERANLATHLRMAHEMQSGDYKRAFPNAAVVCDTLRATHSRMRPCVTPHWESVWSPEYVLDRIADFQRRGFPVNSDWIRRKEPNFSGAGFRFFGNWSDVLRRVGIDPREVYREVVRVRRRYPTKRSIVRELRRRRSKGLPISSHQLRRDGGDHALLETGAKCFGSWSDALRAAGYSPDAIYREGILRIKRYPTKDAVIREIRRRRRQGLPLSYLGVIQGRHADSALYLTARQHFGRWTKALETVGMRGDEHRRESGRSRRKYPDKESLILGIRQRMQAGLPLTKHAIKRGRPSDVSLLRRAKEYCGSFENALRAARRKR